MKYMTNDGVIISGDTPTKVIKALRKNAWFPGKDLEAYMQKTAYFAELQTGKRIRKDTAENILKDLIKAGLLKQIWVN